MPHEYYLITKNLNRKFVKYKGTAQRLSSQKPYSYDEVIIGKYGKFEDISIITTFRDSKGNIIERCFDIVGKPLNNRLYTVRENTIGEDKIVKSTHIKQYSIKRKYYERCKDEISEINNKTLFFTPEKFETHHISTNINTGEKVFSHVIQSNLTKPTKEIHTFVEYPHIIGGKIQKAKKKMLEFMVNTINYKIAPNSVKAQGVCVPKHDEYLAYRALDIEDAKVPLSLKYIKERKLNNMDIIINPYYHPIDETDRRAKSIFDSTDGSINYRYNYKYKSKQELAESARHEVEHAWQFFLHARNTGGDSIWQLNRFFQFGPIKSKKMQAEAASYTNSINNYVSLGENPVEYKKNYIEINARKAGKKEALKYERHNKEISRAFPFIPKELL